MTFWNWIYLVVGFYFGYNFGVPIVKFFKDLISEIKG